MQEFAEPVVGATKRAKKRAPRRRVAQGSVRHADGSVMPAVDRRGRDAGDMGGIAGFGCLD